MRLVLNLSMLNSRPTGIGVYAEHCARAMAERFDVGLIAGSSTISIGGCVVAKAPESIAFDQGRVGALKRLLWLRSLDFGDDDLIYSPTHHGPPRSSNQIVTVHDTIRLRFPEQNRPQYLYFKYLLPRFLKKCRAVFTISETSRHDIAETYGFPLDRIFVAPPGVNTSAFRAEPSRVSVENPYLLMVGTRLPHKNVHEVLREARCWAADYRLVITSCGGAYKERLIALVNKLGLQPAVEFRDYVDQDELVRLYQGSSALIYPSMWEGFGIPPLEALASGKPVIASDIPVHREVLGDAAIYVKLGRSDSWGEAFEKLRQPDHLKKRELAGQEVLGRFTWANCAAALEQSLLAVEPRLKLYGN